MFVDTVLIRQTPNLINNLTAKTFYNQRYALGTFQPGLNYIQYCLKNLVVNNNSLYKSLWDTQANGFLPS